MQYLTLTRYAARVLNGLGWPVYDYKFGQKAGHNKYRVWSGIGQQLWLTIFAVEPSVLKEVYPSFFEGLQTNSVVFTDISMGLLPRPHVTFGSCFWLFVNREYTLCICGDDVLHTGRPLSHRHIVSYFGGLGPQDSLVTLVTMVPTLLMIGPLERITTFLVAWALEPQRERIKNSKWCGD